MKQKRLKSWLLMCALMAMQGMAYAKVNAPQSVTFDKEKYNLVFQEDHSNQDSVISEYLRPGEKLESFNKMFSIFEKPQTTDIHAFAKSLAQSGEAQNGVNHLTFSAFFDEKKNEYLISKVIMTPAVSEFVVYRIMMHQGHVRYYFYSHRTYLDLREERNQPAFKAWLEATTQKNKAWVSEITQLKY